MRLPLTGWGCGSGCASAGVLLKGSLEPLRADGALLLYFLRPSLVVTVLVATVFGATVSGRRFYRLRGFGFSCSLRSRHLSDARIAGENELAGVQSGLFEIRRVGRKNLPARYLLPEYLDGAHAGKVALESCVMLHGRG
jgi:hypothetical protein